jgi:hypothetical protein
MAQLVSRNLQKVAQLHESLDTNILTTTCSVAGWGLVF